MNETQWANTLAQGRIQDFSWGGGQTKKLGNLAPVTPIVHMAPNLVLQLGKLVHFCLYGPDFGHKLALFKTKINDFFHKNINVLAQRESAFSCILLRSKSAGKLGGVN